MRDPQRFPFLYIDIAKEPTIDITNLISYAVAITTAYLLLLPIIYRRVSPFTAHQYIL